MADVRINPNRNPKLVIREIIFEILQPMWSA